MQQTSTKRPRPLGIFRLSAAAALLAALGIVPYASTLANGPPIAAPTTRATAPIVAQAEPQAPTISAALALASLDRDIEASPWLRSSDEFAAWVDDTGNRCQVATAATSDKLRELDYLLNEHWIGKRAASVIAMSATGLAASDPISGVGATAAGVVYVIKSSDQWTNALADQSDDLGQWIEDVTEQWERYAVAYDRAHESPSAESINEWIDAAQALLPYLEQGEHIVTRLNELAGDIDQRLAGAHEYLDGMDHWSVQWLADSANGSIISPALDKLRELEPKLQMTQGQLMLDQGLIATMPMRFERLVIVD